MADDLDRYLPPLIVRRGEAINVAHAMSLTGLSDKNVRRLFDRFKLGAKAEKNSPLWISEPGLIMAFHGDYAALELLRAGKRDHPLVARYFEHLGYVYAVQRRRGVSEPEPLPEWRRRKDMSPSELKLIDACPGTRESVEALSA